MNTKPFLKWAGGKAKLVSFIEQFFPDKKRIRLIEPFSGSAALSLALEFDAYLLNDKNLDLINLFKALKQEKGGFVDYAHSFFEAENNQESRFYELRERFNASEDSLERSALFVYLNRHAFNGLCRYNNSGLFNVPFGRYKSPYFPMLEMHNFIQKSDRVALHCGDFQDVLQQAGSDDFIYCDPPYAPLTETASFTHYAQGGFNGREQQRLAELAEAGCNRGQNILISNHDIPFTRDLYRNARIETVDVQRNIAASGSSRRKVTELLAIYEPGNPNA
ncbi:DNA adenine methylase [Bergeriella denitrificans]|uniref:Site-specific DNA-methyltransferase (adenine-specific) n=1 Tax=Bergeriella denitrificans TaxID=494 RepID=A0A378UD91_BERDE|nr:Dam family site-specific DNA-(adenine-N6)-methyltransferase [Bergeriella denitrificans]STZ75374.1 putative type II DNA modification methylase [Bergeriella denitrificans]